MTDGMEQAPQLEKHHQLPLYFALVALIAAIVGAAGTFFYFSNQQSSLETEYSLEQTRLENAHLEQVQMLQGQITEKDERLANAFEAPENLGPAELASFVYNWRLIRKNSSIDLPNWDENASYITGNLATILSTSVSTTDPIFCSEKTESVSGISITNQGASSAQVALQLNSPITQEVPIIINLINDESHWKIDTITCPPVPQPEEEEAQA